MLDLADLRPVSSSPLVALLFVTAVAGAADRLYSS